MALDRPVLVDDAALVPLAFSRQWGAIDPVRSGSILSRGASAAVRDALFAQGIAQATGPVRTRGVPELSMGARVCVPVRRDGAVHGFVWLLDPEGDLGEDELRAAQEAAVDAAALLAGRPDARLAEDSELVSRLCADDESVRRAAARVAADTGRLVSGPIVALSAAALEGASPRLGDFARRLVQRAERGHVLAGLVDGRVLVLLQPDTPVMRVVPAMALAAWALQAADGAIAVGQSAIHPSAVDLPAARREADIALRRAGTRAPHRTEAAWELLGVERILAQLSPSAVDDLPLEVRRVLEGNAALRATVAAYLDCGGDIKRTAAQLSLHRSGVYYRLQRLQELTGLDLARGDDRLLLQLGLFLLPERS